MYTAIYNSLYCSNSVTTTGIVFVKRRVGHLPYEDDKDVSIYVLPVCVYAWCMCVHTYVCM